MNPKKCEIMVPRSLESRNYGDREEMVFYSRCIGGAYRERQISKIWNKISHSAAEQHHSASQWSVLFSSTIFVFRSILAKRCCTCTYTITFCAPMKYRVMHMRAFKLAVGFSMEFFQRKKRKKTINRYLGKVPEPYLTNAVPKKESLWLKWFYK